MDLGLTYTKIGDYYYPDIAPSDTTKYEIGYYGRKHERYLKEHRPSVWARLVLTEELLRHLYEVDTACNEQMEYLIKEIAKREGVTEALKASDQLEWVRCMNGIHNRAEEIIIAELVYTEDGRA